VCSSTPLYSKDGTSDNKTAPVSSENEESPSEKAKSKLKLLLMSMDTMTESTNSIKMLDLNFAKPKRPQKKKKREEIQKKSIEESIGKEMKLAVEKVSNTFPLTKEKTKLDLLDKLQAVALETSLMKSKRESNEGQLRELEVKPKHERQQDEQKLNNILSGLKVVKSRELPIFSLTSTRPRESLSAGEPLGIFRNVQFVEPTDAAELVTWEKLQTREIRLAVTQAPANGFQQMIRWTRQGKLWHFPINNEQGLEEEAQVGFHEHVFLEHHLEPWCPKRGPIRNFMELVCIGLSKNPYLSVAQKKEHIEWYRRYFDDKRSILVETGALAEAASSTQQSALA